MEKNIKDYIPFYLGCNCAVTGISEGDNETFKITGISYDDTQRIWWGYFENTEFGYAQVEDIWMKIRPLSDMTEEEKEEFIELCGLEPEDSSCVIKTRDEFFPEPETYYGTAHLTNIAQWAVGVKYLLSKHFDLFELIECGLAIDATKQLAK